jgi:hypothetical protein
LAAASVVSVAASTGAALAAGSGAQGSKAHDFSSPAPSLVAQATPGVRGYYSSRQAWPLDKAATS